MQGCLWESPDLRTYAAAGSDASVQHLFVLDWWYVATIGVARSFTMGLSANFSAHARSLLRRGFRGPPWAHFFWAHYLTRVLPDAGPEGARIRFLPLLNGRDFVLARFVRFGRACEAPVKWPALLGQTLNATAAAVASRSMDPKLEAQCPHRMQRGTNLACPWYAPVCQGEHAASVVAAIIRAKCALRHEGLNLVHAFDRGYVNRHVRVQLEGERYQHVVSGVEREGLLPRLGPAH